MKVQHMHIEFL